MTSKIDAVISFTAAVQGMVAAHGSLEACLERENGLGRATAMAEARRLRKRYRELRLAYPKLEIQPLSAFHTEATKALRKAAAAARAAERRGKWDAKRLGELAAMFADGRTMIECGAHFGVSPQRISMLLQRLEINARDGGKSADAKAKQAARRKIADERRDAKARASFRCSHRDYLEVVAASLAWENANRDLLGHGTFWRKFACLATAKYSALEQAAKYHGIAFTITLPDYWKLIEPHLGALLRTARKGERMVVARIDRSRGYEPGNLVLRLARDHGKILAAEVALRGRVE